ncbi:reverse transcriptase zinc-binding domain-containing protein [Artemisia annua]|uniref:Reverse transcriptase zinc-binding domain-containing protein n=1 Tax=Artemisia annua TaxID=35608 RepID=A0A2U1NL32_ARTAN|nr:reverse transcriptase zinc-binding domain-containing protein [Artemisia annua]
MSRALRWRVRGGNPKEEQKKVGCLWVKATWPRIRGGLALDPPCLQERMDKKGAGFSIFGSGGSPRGFTLPIPQSFALLKRFPVRATLDDIGIDLHTLLCPSCNDIMESLDHCFVLCPKVQLVWKQVFEWWGLENVGVFSVQDVLTLPGINSFNNINIERWKAVIWSTLCIIWSNMNQMIFRRNGSMIPDLFKEVQLRTFEWISARSKKEDVKREEWFGGLIDHV